MFAGFCKEPKDGGLKGINFRAENTVKIGNTFATQWVVTAPFLAEPYKGSDAYIIENGYLRAMVSTFDGKVFENEMIPASFSLSAIPRSRLGTWYCREHKPRRLL